MSTCQLNQHSLTCWDIIILIVRNATKVLCWSDKEKIMSIHKVRKSISIGIRPFGCETKSKIIVYIYTHTLKLLRVLTKDG